MQYPQFKLWLFYIALSIQSTLNTNDDDYGKDETNMHAIAYVKQLLQTYKKALKEIIHISLKYSNVCKSKINSTSSSVNFPYIRITSQRSNFQYVCLIYKLLDIWGIPKHHN